MLCLDAYYIFCFLCLYPVYQYQWWQLLCLGILWKEALCFIHKGVKTFWTFCSLFAIDFLTCSKIGIFYEVHPSLLSSDLYFWYWQGNLQADQQIRLCDVFALHHWRLLKRLHQHSAVQCPSKNDWLLKISVEGVNLFCGKIACYVQSLGD